MSHRAKAIRLSIDHIVVGVCWSVSIIGFLLLLVAVHDAAMPEDLTALWVCGVQGDGVCGPNQSPVMVEPLNLFRNWDIVARELFEQN